MSTVLPSLPRATHTSPGDRVVPGALATQRHPGTVQSIPPGWARDVAVGSYEARQTFTAARGRGTPSSVQTLALSLTVRTVPTRNALLVTLGSLETWGAVAGPGHWVALLVHLRALAHLVTVESIRPWQTHLLTAVPREPRRAATRSGHMVTGGARRAPAALLTAPPEAPWETGSITLGSPPSR